MESQSLPVLDDVLDACRSGSDAALDLEDDLADGLDGGTDQLHVDVARVFFKLLKDLIAVAFVGDLDQNVNFLKFDINWIIEFTIKHFDVVFENRGLLL